MPSEEEMSHATCTQGGCTCDPSVGDAPSAEQMDALAGKLEDLQAKMYADGAALRRTITLDPLAGIKAQRDSLTMRVGKLTAAIEYGDAHPEVGEFLRMLEG